MALIFTPQYTLNFDTTAGQDINWEVDILRSYDDSGPQPSHFFASPVALIGDSDPVVVRYERDYDVYKPIQGSSADLNVIINSAVRGQVGAVDDFASGTPYEWQLRIRYRDADNNLQPYWCGFFNPVETTEKVSTFPFGISYTAVDGLGLLEQATPTRPTVDSQISIFSEIIVPALRQTGLELDIYVESGLLNGANDALTTATASSFSVYSSLDDNGTLYTYKEILEGWLSAFNCHITQANGRWYIYNASTLGDSVTWDVYDHEGAAGTAVTESLVLTIDGTSTQNLVPANDDLQLTLRRPAGSIECEPRGLVEREFAANGNFSNGAEGWTIDTSHARVDTTNNVFTIFRNYFHRHTVLANPLLTNTTGWQVDRDASIQVEFDWRITKIFEDAVSMYWRVYAEFDMENVNEVTMPTQQYNSAAYYSQYNSVWRGFNYTPVTQINRLYWNPNDNVWQVGSGENTLISYQQRTTNEWFNVSETFRNPTTFFPQSGQAALSNLRFFVQFFPLRSRDGRRWDGSSTTRVEVDIDNISVRNMFESNMIMPTLERVQTNYTHTIEYMPLFASSISNSILQKISPTNFTRTIIPGVSSQTGTLEEIVTQWKLNDYRTQFKYYEGSLINLSATPMSAINKINLNWSSVGYVETAAGIINGGNFNLKKNQFETAFYIPNQGTDVGSSYFTENVDLVPMPFPGRSSKVTYTLAFRVDADDENDMAVANGLVPDVPFIQFVGEPGEMINYTLNLVPLANYVGASGATAIAANTETTPTPEFATFGAFFNSSTGNISLPIQITMPDISEFEELFIEGGVIRFTPEATPGVVAQEIVISHNIANVDTATATTIPVTGVPGSRIPVSFDIEANEGRLMQNVDETHSNTNLSNGVVTGNGTRTATISFVYEVTSTANLAVSVTVTGSTTPEPSAGVTIVTRNLNITNNLANTSVIDGLTVPFTGVVGDIIDRNITVDPSSDRFISSITGTTTTGSIVDVGTPYASGEDWEVPVRFSILSGTDDGTLAIGGTTMLEPYSLTFNVNNIGLDASQIDVNTHRITFDEGDFGDPISAFVITVSPKDGMVYTSADNLQVDVNEASVVVSDGSTISLPESQFTVSRVLSNGNIRITIAGSFPNTGGQYGIAINILGTPTLQNATIGSYGVNSLSFPANGGTQVIPVVTDGQWISLSQSSHTGWLQTNSEGTSTSNGSVTFTVLPENSFTSGAQSVVFNLYPAGTTTGTPLNQITISRDSASQVESDDVMTIQMVSSLPSSPNSNTLYLIPRS